MPHTRRTISTLLSVSALAIATSMALTTPAMAASARCSAYQSKTFATPGDNTKVTLRLCIRMVNGHAFERVQGSWTHGAGHAEIDKFDRFDIHLFLERNQATYDNGLALTLKTNINYHETGTFDHEVGPITTDTGGRLPSGKWTTDGQVIYDLNNDGQSGYVWDLTGSPSITL